MMDSLCRKRKLADSFIPFILTLSKGLRFTVIQKDVAREGSFSPLIQETCSVCIYLKCFSFIRAAMIAQSLREPLVRTHQCIRSLL